MIKIRFGLVREVNETPKSRMNENRKRPNPICLYKIIGLELFEKYETSIFSINFRVRQLKLKIAKVNLN